MSTLQIRKKSLKTWIHVDSVLGEFIISKFYFNADDNEFQIVEQGQSKRFKYSILNITLFDDTDSGTAETFSTIEELSLRLEELNYPAFNIDGAITSISGLIQAGTNVAITGLGTASSPYVISATGGGSSLTIYESGETPIVDINEIEVIGATVTDDGGGKVTLEVVGGGMENVTQRIFTVTLSDINATDFTDDIPGKIKTYAIANGIQKLQNETHDWEVTENFNFYLRISGTDMYDNYGIEDEASFILFFEKIATNIEVTDFYLSADTLRCNLSFDGATGLSLSTFGISKIINLNSLVNLTYLDLRYNQLTTIENLDSLVNLTYLDLRYNQLTTIENLDALVNLTYLDLRYNQLTTIENLDSLVNLTSLGLGNNQLTTTEFNKLNSWAILAPNNGTIYASNNIDNFNLSTTYTTLLAKGWTINT